MQARKDVVRLTASGNKNNCAFNSFMLGLRVVIAEGKLDNEQKAFEPFFKFLLDNHHIQKAITWEAFKKYLLTTDAGELERRLAKPFREFSVYLTKNDELIRARHREMTKSMLLAKFHRVQQMKEGKLIEEKTFGGRDDILTFPYIDKAIETAKDEKSLGDWWDKKEEEGGHNQFFEHIRQEGAVAGDLELAPLAKFWKVNVKVTSPRLGGEYLIYADRGHINDLKVYQRDQLNTLGIIEREPIGKDQKGDLYTWAADFRNEEEILSLITPVMDNMNRAQLQQNLEAFASSRTEKKDEFLPTDLTGITVSKEYLAILFLPQDITDEFLALLIQRGALKAITDKPGSYEFIGQVTTVLDKITGLEKVERDKLMEVWRTRKQQPTINLANDDAFHWEPEIKVGELTDRFLFEILKLPVIHERPLIRSDAQFDQTKFDHLIHQQNLTAYREQLFNQLRSKDVPNVFINMINKKEIARLRRNLGITTVLKPAAPSPEQKHPAAAVGGPTAPVAAPGSVPTPSVSVPADVKRDQQSGQPFVGRVKTEERSRDIERDVRGRPQPAPAPKIPQTAQTQPKPQTQQAQTAQAQAQRQQAQTPSQVTPITKPLSKELDDEKTLQLLRDRTAELKEKIKKLEDEAQRELNTKGTDRKSSFEATEEKPKIAGYPSDYLKIEARKKNIPIGNHDYKKSIRLADGVTVGVCEIQGDRLEQEDSLQVSLVEGFQTLTEEEQKAVLKETYDAFQEKHKKAEAGSTGNTTVAWLKGNELKVVNANLGDSTSYLVILQSDGALASSQLLNKLHKPDDKDEKKRIEAADGRVVQDRYGIHRVNGELSVSRAFGDAEVGAQALRLGYIEGIKPGAGMGHEAEILSKSVTLKPGQTAFIVTACDGLTEEHFRTGKPVHTPESIGKEVAKYRQHPEKASETLIDIAFKKGSGDNISVAVLPVGTQPVSASVFDGHVKASVSMDIGPNFYPVLKAKVAKYQAKKELQDVEAQIRVSTNHRMVAEQATILKDTITKRQEDREKRQREEQEKRNKEIEEQKRRQEEISHREAEIKKALDEHKLAESKINDKESTEFKKANEELWKAEAEANKAKEEEAAAEKARKTALAAEEKAIETARIAQEEAEKASKDAETKKIATETKSELKTEEKKVESKTEAKDGSSAPDKQEEKQPEANKQKTEEEAAKLVAVATEAKREAERKNTLAEEAKRAVTQATEAKLKAENDANTIKAKAEQTRRTFEEAKQTQDTLRNTIAASIAERKANVEKIKRDAETIKKLQEQEAKKLAALEEKQKKDSDALKLKTEDMELQREINAEVKRLREERKAETLSTETKKQNYDSIEKLIESLLLVHSHAIDNTLKKQIKMVIEKTLKLLEEEGQKDKKEFLEDRSKEILLYKEDEVFQLPPTVIEAADDKEGKPELTSLAPGHSNVIKYGQARNFHIDKGKTKGCVLYAKLKDALEMSIEIPADAKTEFASPNSNDLKTRAPDAYLELACKAIFTFMGIPGKTIGTEENKIIIQTEPQTPEDENKIKAFILVCQAKGLKYQLDFDPKSPLHGYEPSEEDITYLKKQTYFQSVDLTDAVKQEKVKAVEKDPDLQKVISDILEGNISPRRIVPLLEVRLGDATLPPPSNRPAP